MESRKETAVEWLNKKLEEYGDPDNCELSWDKLDNIINQAKEMEKEQMIDAYAKCYTPFSFNRIGELDKDFEQYYKETYGK